MECKPTLESRPAGIAELTSELLSVLSVWKDGRVVGPGEAVVSVWDHGLLYGDGVFEGLRVRGGYLFRFDDHLRRLRNSSRILGLPLAYDRDDLLAAVADTLAANALDEAHVRILHTRGFGLPGLDPRRSPKPSLLVLTYPFPPLLGARPVRLITSHVIRKSPRSLDASVKSLNYLDGIMAKLQANAVGADDALMLDDTGLVAEATGANVFVVRDGTLLTPPCTASLPGITRRTVLELAMELGIASVVQPLTVGDVYSAEEAFLTSTAIGILPLAALDGREFAVKDDGVVAAVSRAYERSWQDPRFALRIAA